MSAFDPKRTLGDPPFEGTSVHFYCASFSRYDPLSRRLEADMRRREFIILLGCAAAWPAAAIAQQDNKKRLVGLITAFNEKEMLPLVAAFRSRMQELGWIEGQ